ncbi:zinc finger and BTB domain-containing protein 39, partial [Clarias magur]
QTELGATLAGMRIRLQRSGHAALLLSELNRFRLSRLLCDVVLQVGGRSFPAHRAVLACASSHFSSLLSRGPYGQSATPPTFSLDFISATNFEKVLTFIYTGEILTDLIDVGVLYELAERLGVRELVRACHATFPDMKSSDGDVEADMAPATAMASSMCSSSVASCSSLSSPAAPTPVAPSPLPQNRGNRLNRSHALPLSPKEEDGFQLHLSYNQLANNKQSSLDNHHSQASEILPALNLQLKTEQEEEKVDGNHSSDEQAIINGNKPVLTEVCSVPDSSAQAGGETCAPSSSSGDPLDSLQLRVVEGGVGLGVGAVKDAILFEEEDDAEKKSLHDGPLDDGEQWRALAGDIIELSDDEENYIEEEEDDEDLMCIENGGSGIPVHQGHLAPSSQPCKTCGALLQADNNVLRSHAETHLSETGSCRVCGTSFNDRASSVAHALTHVGILLFSCEICELQFCTEAELIRHRRQSVARCVPQMPEQFNSANQGPGGELHCAVCTKSIPKDLK